MARPSGTLTGEEAIWSALAMTYLAGRLDRLDPYAQSRFAPGLVRLANALQPGCLLKVGASRPPFSFLSPVNVVSTDDAHWGIAALMLLRNQIREREPMWASLFMPVAAAVRQNSTIRIAKLRLPMSILAPEFTARARDLWATVEMSNITISDDVVATSR
jgi:hypothetical protein